MYSASVGRNGGIVVRAQLRLGALMECKRSCDGIIGVFGHTCQRKRHVHQAECHPMTERGMAAGACVADTEQFGLGHAELIAFNPRLISVSTALFGHSGPMSTIPGFRDPMELLTYDVNKIAELAIAQVLE